MDADTTHSVTLISIVIGLGLTELLMNFHRLLRARAQVRWDGLPLLWTATVLIFLLNYWWALIRGLDGSRLAHTAGEYGLLLAHPILLFLLCATVLPRASEEGIDMRAAYARERDVFVLLFLLYVIGNWTLAFLIAPVAWTSSTTILRLAASALIVSLLLIKNRRWDWVVAAAILVLGASRLTLQDVR
jgi:hypothetical protein